MSESEISQNATCKDPDCPFDKLAREWKEKNDLQAFSEWIHDENGYEYASEEAIATIKMIREEFDKRFPSDSLRVSKEASLRELEKINDEADRLYGKGSLVSEFIVQYRERRELERPTKT